MPLISDHLYAEGALLLQDFVEKREDPLDAVVGSVPNGNAAPTDPALVARTELLINQDRRITLDYGTH